MATSGVLPFHNMQIGPSHHFLWRLVKMTSIQASQETLTIHFLPQNSSRHRTLKSDLY